MIEDQFKIIDIPILGDLSAEVYALDVESLDIESLLHDNKYPLSTYRKEHALSYVQEADQKRSLGAAILTDHFLRQHNLREYKMEYGKNAFGKPFFKHCPELHFNLSHSGKFAIAAFDRRPIGIDIEHITPYEKTYAAYCMQPSETTSLEACPKALHDCLFTSGWCLKEAILKAIGTGIDETFPIIHFEKGMPEWDGGSGLQLKYRLFQLEDYMGAVVFSSL